MKIYVYVHILYVCVCRNVKDILIKDTGYH